MVLPGSSQFARLRDPALPACRRAGWPTLHEERASIRPRGTLPGARGGAGEPGQPLRPRRHRLRTRYPRPPALRIGSRQRPLHARRADDTLRAAAGRQRLPHPPSAARLAAAAHRQGGLCPIASEGAVRSSARRARWSRHLSPRGARQRARAGKRARGRRVDARVDGRAERGHLLRPGLGNAHRFGGRWVLGRRLRSEHAPHFALLGRRGEAPRAPGAGCDRVPCAIRPGGLQRPTGGGAPCRWPRRCAGARVRRGRV